MALPCGTVRGTVIYSRQSRSARTSFSSCESQLAICHDTARSQSWVVAQAFSDEGESSETLDRPALQRLISAIEDGQVERLVVYSIDRLSRRLADLARLFQLFDAHQVALFVVTDPNYGSSAASRLVTNIIAGASQFQQELNRERMADARLALKLRGKRVAGRVPFGYQIAPGTKALAPDPGSLDVVRSFFELAAAGTPPSQLAKLANQNRWRDHRGETEKWTARRITTLLRNPTYVGDIRNGKSTLPGEHQAIVNRELFEAAQRHLEIRKRRHPKGVRWKRVRNPYGAKLLGMLVCGSCNRPMSISVSQRGKIRYAYYRCRSQAGGRPPCPGVNILVYELERFICSLLENDEGGEPPIPAQWRAIWNRVPKFSRAKTLPKVLHRAIYHPAAGQITLELKDAEAWESLAKAVNQKG